MPETFKNAVLSDCGRYRYRLDRWWNGLFTSDRRVNFLMLKTETSPKNAGFLLCFGTINIMMMRAVQRCERPPHGSTRHAETSGKRGPAMAARYLTTPAPRSLILPPDPYSGDPYSWTRVIFRPVADWPGYGVDTDGNVWSCRNSHGRLVPPWRKLRPRPDKDGYLSVVLNRGGPANRKTVRVAHLVLLAFVGPRPAGAESRHFPDPNPSNNATCNLAWGSHAENIRDKVTMGTVARGVRHGMARLSEEDVAEVKRLRARGLTYEAIGVRMGITGSYAHNLVIGRYRKHG